MLHSSLMSLNLNIYRFLENWIKYTFAHYCLPSPIFHSHNSHSSIQLRTLNYYIGPSKTIFTSVMVEKYDSYWLAKNDQTKIKTKGSKQVSECLKISTSTIWSIKNTFVLHPVSIKINWWPWVWIYVSFRVPGHPQWNINKVLQYPLYFRVFSFYWL